MTGQDFVNAIARMYDAKEFDKIIDTKYCTLHRAMHKSRLMIHRESKSAKAVKTQLDNYVNAGRDIKDIPFIPLLMQIDSAEVLRDAICFMIEDSKKDV